MDTSHLRFAVHDPDTFDHLQRQNLTQRFLPHNNSNHQLQPHRDENPPSKRRRSNSLNSSGPSIPATTSLPASAHWLQPPQQQLQTPNNDGLSRSHSYSYCISRDKSPERTSHVSASSSLPLNGPQLRKKPKSSSIKNTEKLRAASNAIPKSPSVPTFYPAVQPVTNPVNLVINTSATTTPSISRADSSASQNQSPNQKRPPASHSSYGVETICGPPPSYSTQRTLSQERIRKQDRKSQFRMQTNPPDHIQANGLDGTYEAVTQKKEGTLVLNQSSPDTVDTHSIPTPTDAEHTASVKIRNEPRMSMDEDGKASSSDERRSEDLFLNIAKVDAARPQQKPEKRRSRLSIPFLPSSRSSNKPRNSPPELGFEAGPVQTPQPQPPPAPFHQQRASLGGLPLGTTSSRSNLAESSRLREKASDLNSDHGRSNSTGYTVGQGGFMNGSTETNRLTHRSSTGLRNSRLVSDITPADNSRTGEQIATESTVSTTAPSTVWDELDDLKSRIRKLELTGKLPPSSAAAMASTERPRTATTATTAMSTSPKYKPSETNHQSPVDQVPVAIQPLLYEALDNARTVLSHDVYQKLQATAQDALQVANMMISESAAGRNYATTLSNERQLRRRTEGICRGLTELAIALVAEGKPTQSVIRPNSRDQSLPPNSMLRGRRYSNDPATRDYMSGRVQSRLDSRRTSIQLARTGAGYSSPEHGQYQSPASASQVADARLNRSSTLLRRRGQGSFDGIDDQLDNSPSIRPGSRAMTDLGAYRRISRDPTRASREYTSQNPLPTQQTQSATIANNHNAAFAGGTNTNFTSRRKQVSPARTVGVTDSIPLTPQEVWRRMSSVHVDSQSPDMVMEAGGLGRMGSSRRSMADSNHVTSSVGSRLRAVRAQRNSREQIDLHGSRDVLPSLHSDRTPGSATAETYSTTDFPRTRQSRHLE